MRLLLVLLLLPLVILPGIEGFFSGRRRIWQKIKWLFVKCDDKNGKNGRDVTDLDENKDGVIDQSEAGKVIGARFAGEVLSRAKDNGNSKVSLKEFSRSLRSILADADAKTEDEEDSE